MYQTAKKAREAMKSKAKRLASDRPLQKVDSSTFTPPEMLKADVTIMAVSCSLVMVRRTGRFCA